MRGKVMRNKSGIDSILEEERFEQKLRRLANLSKSERKKKWYGINARERNFALDHMITNEAIESHRRFKDEWEKENPDGEYPET